MLKQTSILLLAAAGMGLSLPAATQPVGDALSRPSVKLAKPARGVLLSAAQAGERVVAVGERGLIALSDDRGQTWRQVPSPASVTLTMVRFADASHGVAVGHGGMVLVTRDGGDTWQQRLDGRRAAELALKAAITEREQVHAQRLVDDGPDKPLLDVLLWDTRRMLVVGAYGLAFYSEDGGDTWTSWMHKVPNPNGFHWYVVRRQGETVMLAGEQGLMARSIDGGQRFEALTSPYRGSWFAGEFAADGSLVLAGLRGNLWRSTDVGQTWGQLLVPVPASLVGGAVTRDGAVAFVNQAGFVVRVQGVDVALLNKASLVMPAAVLPLAGPDNNEFLVVGMTGVQMLKLGAGNGVTRP